MRGLWNFAPGQGEGGHGPNLDEAWVRLDLDEYGGSDHSLVLCVEGKALA